MICHFCESVDSGDYESCIDCAKEMTERIFSLGIVENAKSANMEKRKMPPKGRICRYWRRILVGEDGECIIPYGEDFHLINKDNCFACNINHLIGKGIVYRCHILPRAEGGSDKESNIHLLCKGCHEESENLRGEKYFNWFFRMSMSISFSRFFIKKFGLDLGGRILSGDKSKGTTEELFFCLERYLGNKKATELLVDRLEVKQGELF